MKQRSTTPVSKGIVTRSLIVAAVVTSLVVSPFALDKTVRADDYDARIAELQSKIDSYQASANELSRQAKTLQDELAVLDGQKAEIQTKIDLTQAKFDKLQHDIDETKRQIKENQDALGDTIADIYTEDKVSPLEMLASSDTVADYVDAQAFRDTIRDELTSTIDRIDTLKKQLEEQKIAVERTLIDQNNSKKALVAKETERSNLLAKTQSDEAAFQRLKGEAAAQQKKVMEEQQAAISAALARAGGGGSMVNVGNLGSYSSWVGNCYVDWNAMSYSIDPLGYGCNQCVSYAAWRAVQATGGRVTPYYWGNANMWPASARAYGLRVDGQPSGNSLGVISAGTYGHIVYIHSYNASNNTVNISQYNEYIPGGSPTPWGHYSERYNVPAYTYDTYIHL